MIHTATYSPDDDKLRLYPAARLDDETYRLVRQAGFIWAPGQEVFVAPSWNPGREDLLVKLCGDIEDDDKSLAVRAEERADRFEGYAESRREESDAAFAAGRRLADTIPSGQPILRGHHSESRARRDAERIASAGAAGVRLWRTATYWEDRAAAALDHAKYKQQPQVRARRINKLEADRRGYQRRREAAERALTAWRAERLTREDALRIASKYNYRSSSFPLAEYPREAPANLYEGPMSLFDALEGLVITPAKARELAVPGHEAVIRQADRVDRPPAVQAHVRAGHAQGARRPRHRPEEAGGGRSVPLPLGSNWRVGRHPAGEPEIRDHSPHK